MKYIYIGFITLLTSSFVNAQKLKDLKQVLPMGNDTYMYTREAGTGFTRQTKLLKKAMLVIEAFAETKDKEFEIVKIFKNEGPFILGNYPRVEVTFKLLQ